MMTEPEIQRSLAGHTARNIDLIRNLVQKGVDVAEPRSIDLHFWAGSQKDACFLAKALYESGYLILQLSPSVKSDPKGGLGSSRPRDFALSLSQIRA